MLIDHDQYIKIVVKQLNTVCHKLDAALLKICNKNEPYHKEHSDIFGTEISERFKTCQEELKDMMLILTEKNRISSSP